MSSPVRLLVLQWAHPGGVAALAAVEDELTPLARRDGAVVDRDRALEPMDDDTRAHRGR